MFNTNRLLKMLWCQFESYVKHLLLYIFLLQSHISENEEEVKLVENMFPAYQNYTELYDKNKLLTSKVTA